MVCQVCCRLFIYLCIYLLFLCLFIYLFVCVCLHASMCVCLCISLSVCLSARLWARSIGLFQPLPEEVQCARPSQLLQLGCYSQKPPLPTLLLVGAGRSRKRGVLVQILLEEAGRAQSNICWSDGCLLLACNLPVCLLFVCLLFVYLFVACLSN